jgi:protein TonB
MLIIAAIVIVGVNVPRLLDLLKPKQPIYTTVFDESMRFTQLKPEKDNEIKTEPIAPPPPAYIESIRFVTPKVTDDVNVDENKDAMKPQEILNNSKGVISFIDVKGSPDGKILKADEIEKVTGKIESEGNIPTHIEQMPEFPGGEKELLNYICKNLQYPTISQEMGVQGKVILRFVVSKNGMVDKVEVLRALDEACNNEAIRVVKTLPKFIPGKQNGTNVSVWFTLPITFKLDN